MMNVLCQKSQLSGEYPFKVDLSDGTSIAVYLIEGQVYATDDLCSHGEASLSDGYVDGFDVVCPFHLGAFDVRTGAATKEPCYKAVKTYAVRLDGDQVILENAVDTV